MRAGSSEREREPLPDLLLVDGGKGQLAVVSAALADAGIAATRGVDREGARRGSPRRA